MNPLTALSTGVKCWPQWKDWGFCYQTGNLIDPNGQAYSPGLIQGGAWLRQMQELRDRLIFADNGTTVPALTTDDMGRTSKNPIRDERERQNEAHKAALEL
ncbi:MAG: hypothetical protein QM612_02215 [Thermomonas sp.]|uniref:hypothetical protein n=1 Tax=Thermomonas sp. TaxID=1971895 RepID=UPI0039E3EE21